MQASRWMSLLGFMVVVACGGGPDEAEMEDSDPAADEYATELACEPSDRMDVVGRASPYDSATIRVGEGAAKICYGRPSLRDRTMIGGDAVPYDTLWRTGANEPTIVHLDVPARIAELEVEPGSYSLYTVPREGDEWTLIVNRSTSQWGHESAYTPEVRAQEVGRVEVEAETLDSPVEQLTIRPMGVGPDEGQAVGREGVILEWQNSRVRIPITAG